MGIFGGKVEKSEFAVLAAGTYTCIIERAEIKTGKPKLGKPIGNKYLSYSFKVVEGEGKGRLIFDGMYWSSEGALNITRGRLGDIGISDADRDIIDETNIVSAINAAKEGKQYKVKVGVIEDETYGPKNTVKSFSIVDFCDVVVYVPELLIAFPKTQYSLQLNRWVI